MPRIPFAYRRLGVGQEKTPLQEDIAGVADTAAGVLATGGAAAVDLASRVGSYVLGTPKTELYKGLRIPSPTPPPGEVPPPAAALGTPIPVKPTGPTAAATPTEGKPHKWDKYKDIYEALADIPDAEFKAYVDRHPDAAGLGYAAGAKGKMERVIERPAPPPGPTAKQLTAMGTYQRGVGSREIAKELEIGRRERATADRSLKTQQAFEKQLNVYAIDKMTGEFNAEKGLFEMVQLGHPVPETHSAAAERVFAPFKSKQKALEEKYKRPLTPQEAQTLKDNYFRAKRWME